VYAVKDFGSVGTNRGGSQNNVHSKKKSGLRTVGLYKLNPRKGVATKDDWPKKVRLQILNVVKTIPTSQKNWEGGQVGGGKEGKMVSEVEKDPNLQKTESPNHRKGGGDGERGTASGKA